MTTALISTKIAQYEPVFNENTGLYEDKQEPYERYKPKLVKYKCFCKHHVFLDNSSWRQHIKTKGHKEALKNYGKGDREKKEQEKELSLNQIQIDKLNRNIAKLNNTIKVQEKLLLAKDKEIIMLREKIIQQPTSDDEEEEFFDIE